MMRIFLILFILGATLGTFGDFFHVFTRTDGYENPFLPLPTGQPLWVPFLFGSASMMIGLSQTLTDRWLGPAKRSVQTFRFCLFGGAVFLGLYALSGFIPHQNVLLKQTVLWCGSILLWAYADRTWQGATLALGTAITGTAFEIFLVKNGVFFYFPHASELFGVPSWLPSLYIAASVSVANFSRRLAA